MLSLKRKCILFCLLSILSSGIYANMSLSITVVDVTRSVFTGAGTGCNGSIKVTASGGLAPYSYLCHELYGSIETGFFFTLNPGTYHLTVTDAQGQHLDTAVIVRAIFPVPSIDTADVIVPSSCNSTDGSFRLIGSGGTPPYQYSIDGAVSFSTNNIFTNLRQGRLRLILKDANGMEAGMIIASRINGNYGENAFSCNCCPFIAIASLDGASCPPDTIGSIIASVGANVPPPVQYSLDGGPYIIDPYPRYYEFFNVSPGLHNVYYKNNLNELVILQVNVLKFCPIKIVSTTVAANCQQADGNITIMASGGMPPYTYSMDGVHYQASNVFTNLAPGIYGFSIRDVNGNFSNGEATISSRCPVISLTKKDETCGLANGTITATGIKGTRPYQYSIDGVHYITDSVFIGLSANPYKIILRDANGFKDSSNITLNNNCLKVFSTSTAEACGKQNGSITATATGGRLPHQFSLDGITYQSGGSFANLAAGIYTVYVKDSLLVVSNTQDTIRAVAGPTISATSTRAGCNGKGGSITINHVGGTTPLAYSIDTMNYQANSIFPGIDSGSYLLRVRDANGCMAFTTTLVNAYPTPQFSLGNDTNLCIGQLLRLNGPVGLGYTFLWQDSSRAINLLARNSGIYWLDVTNTLGCSKRDSIQVNFKPLPIYTLGNDTSICINDSKSLNASVVNASSYQWNNLASTPQLTVSTANTYWCDVTKDGCIYRDSIVIGIKNLPVASLGSDTTLCDGVRIILSATNTNAIYKWQNNSTADTFTVSNAGQYSVVVNKDGCIAKDSIYITYKPKPVFSLGADRLICQTERILLTPALDAAWQLLWQDGSTRNSFVVTQPGLYFLEATNNCGSHREQVQFNLGLCKIYVPSAFSPNSDGINDFFKIFGTSLVSDFHFQVFNRYGQIIFESTDKNKGWDGKYKSYPSEAGMYIYQLNYKEIQTAEVKMMRGSFLLLR